MTSKISVVAAIALAAIVAVPSASYAASQKHKGAASTGLTNPATCTGGGCTSQNPDRVTQPCSGASCYKRSHTKHKSSSTSSK